METAACIPHLNQDCFSNYLKRLGSAFEAALSEESDVLSRGRLPFLLHPVGKSGFSQEDLVSSCDFISSAAGYSTNG